MRYVQKLKLQEEELKYQKKILEIELKADNELNRIWKAYFRIRAAV
jgi:hypothetical protein